MQLYCTNGFTNIVLLSVNCLWLVSVTLIFNGTTQKIVQRYEIATSRWPNDISSAADNAISKNKAQNIDYRFGCVAHSAILLKPNVANTLLFNFCGQKFVHNGSTASPCSFSKKNGPIMPSQLRDDQMTSVLRLIMRSSKTRSKTSSLASAVWHVRPSCWNQIFEISSSSIFVNTNSFNMAR